VGVVTASVAGSGYSVGGSQYYVNGARSSGGGGWPASLDTGLLYRFDASDAATLTLSGSDVTAWADLGPSGFDLAHSETGWPNPTFTADGFAGGPAVQFAQPGSDPLVRASVAVDYSGDHTVGVVYEPHATATVFATVFSHAGAADAGLTFREDNDFSRVCSTVAQGNPRVTAIPAKVPQVVIAAIGPTVGTYERDGVNVLDSSDLAAGASVNGTLVIGAQSIVGVRACKAIGLIAVWSRTLSADDKAAFYAYCAARWAT